MSKVLHDPARRYSSYRESGTEWLGNIPVHWRVTRLKNVLSLSRERNGREPVGEMLSVSGYRGINVKEYDFEERRRIADELADYRVVRRGQLVVNTMWLNYAGLGVSEFEGHVSPAYRAYNIRNALHPRFVHHLMRSALYVGRYCTLLYGVRPNSLQIKNHDWDSLELLIPSMEEQRAIAAFLDRETNRIDALIAKKERLIELLDERLRDVTTRAMTNDVDPTVSAKKMPGLGFAGGKYVKLKYVCSLLRDGTHQPPQRVASGFPLLSVRNVVDERLVRLPDDSMIGEEEFRALERSFSVRRGDVVLAIVGATLGKVAIVELAERFTIQRSLAVMRPRPDKLSPQFLAFFLRSAPFQDLLWQSVGFSAQPGIYLGTLGEFSIPVPSLVEQERIVGLLVSETEETGRLVGIIRRAIALLREYRTALISAAVTGQIDVSER